MKHDPPPHTHVHTYEYTKKGSSSKQGHGTAFYIKGAVIVISIFDVTPV